MPDERTPPVALSVVPDGEVIANQHEEAALLLDAHAARTRRVRDLVRVAGPIVGRPARVELRENTRLMARLLAFQFGDLD
jgi:hypothetical protein